MGSALALGRRQLGPLRVKGGCRRQVDGTAGLPSAPEMPCARRQLRLVPQADSHTTPRMDIIRARSYLLVTVPRFRREASKTITNNFTGVDAGIPG